MTWKDFILKQFATATTVFLSAAGLILAIAVLVWTWKFLIYIWER